MLGLLITLTHSLTHSLRMERAYIQFETPQMAEKACASTSWVCGNRKIKVWMTVSYHCFLPPLPLPVSLSLSLSLSHTHTHTHFLPVSPVSFSLSRSLFLSLSFTHTHTHTHTDTQTSSQSVTHSLTHLLTHDTFMCVWLYHHVTGVPGQIRSSRSPRGRIHGREIGRLVSLLIF